MAENDNINLEITEAIVEAVSPTATVSKDGDTATITVTDKNGTTTASVKDGDKGDKGDQGDKGDKGDKGDTGNTGATGATPELSIGTVSTLGPGEPATATITGTDEQPVLSLGIPKGAKGDTGDTGAAAGFGTVSASVDANIGTPAVSVTASGPNTAKNIAFAFSNLKGAKGDTGATGNGIASIEETATSGAVHTYTITYTNGDTTTFDVTDGEVTNASLATILEDYARINGAYESMTVGNAEQLISSVTVNDKVPYNFRTSGGSIDIGNREVDKLVGGTVAWNQLIQIHNTDKSKTQNGVAFVDNRDGSYTFSTTSEGATAMTYFQIAQVVDGALKDHIYAITGLDASSDATTWTVGDWYSAILQPVVGKAACISKATGNGRLDSRIGVSSGAIITTPIMIRPQYFDLTKMFGSTIADYIYSLETANAGAGVAWFKKLFPKDYYPYNAGELMSVKTSAHQMVGFNAWDEEWRNGYYRASDGAFTANDNYICNKNMIPVLPSTTYFANTNGTQWEIYEYDANGNYLRQLRSAIVDSTFVTDADAHYINIGSHTQATTYNHDICINLSWDGERDGDYEAYKKWTYPLSDLELRGIPKLDSANNLYYDGDTYEDDGTVTRKYGVYTITGSESFSTTSQNQHILNVGTAIYDSIKLSAHNGIIANVTCTFAEVKTYTALNVSGDTDGIGVGSVYIIVGSKQYNNWANLTGEKIVYELATPTTEEADPYQNPQIVDDFGTEEYVDERTVAIPVGHDTEYMNNLKAKLEMAPDSPDGDGDYIVRQTNGENSYVPLMKELPSLPSTDGTYTLKCTVASGVATLGWESEE